MSFPKSSLTAAGYRFEELNGRNLYDYEIKEVERCGLAHTTRSDLESRILAALNTDLRDDPVYRVGAYWALGKSENMELKGFFVSSLSVELVEDIEITFQVMIALDDINEPIFNTNRDGVSILDHEENRRDAMRYLNKM